MATEVFWNEAEAPATQADDVAAVWLAMIARSVGLTSVTADNVGEWLWRFAFTQEMSGRRWGDYRAEVDNLAAALARFRSATLKGRVCDQERDEFIAEYVAAKVECASEQADGAVEANQEHATA